MYMKNNNDVSINKCTIQSQMTFRIKFIHRINRIDISKIFIVCLLCLLHWFNIFLKTLHLFYHPLILNDVFIMTCIFLYTYSLTGTTTSNKYHFSAFIKGSFTSAEVNYSLQLVQEMIISDLLNLKYHFSMILEKLNTQCRSCKEFIYSITSLND